MITCILFGIMYTYSMPSPIRFPVDVCSIVYICKYCVCPHGPYGLLDFEIKLSYYITLVLKPRTV